MCEWDGERKGATDIGIKCENIFSFREREITIPAGGFVVFLLLDVVFPLDFFIFI